QADHPRETFYGVFGIELLDEIGVDQRRLAAALVLALAQRLDALDHDAQHPGADDYAAEDRYCRDHEMRAEKPGSALFRSRRRLGPARPPWTILVPLPACGEVSRWPSRPLRPPAFRHFFSRR